MKLKLVTALLVGLTLCGCGTMRAYDGESRTDEELAHIAGDWRVRSGAPLSLILRRVDESDLGLRYSGVEVLPGQHRLLVDCTVSATAGMTDRVTRHELNVELYAGTHYRLAADTGPGNRECSNVRLEEVN
jgi:hypothetical protein